MLLPKNLLQADLFIYTVAEHHSCCRHFIWRLSQVVCAGVTSKLETQMFFFTSFLRLSQTNKKHLGVENPH